MLVLELTGIQKDVNTIQCCCLITYKTYLYIKEKRYETDWYVLWYFL